MKPNAIYAAGAVLMLLLAACGTINSTPVETIKGSGNAVTVKRDVSAFSSIQINLGAEVILRQSGINSLNVEADENLIAYIKTDVQNDTLIISTPDNIDIIPQSKIQLEIGFDTLRAISVTGTSNVFASDLVLDELAISYSGAGSTRITGTVGEQRINIHGQAIINNMELVSQHVTVDIQGNGTIEVNAQESLHVTVAGMGIIRYAGDPIVTQEISGTAVITSNRAS